MRCKVLRDSDQYGWKAGWNIVPNDRLARQLIAEGVLEEIVPKRGRANAGETATVKPAGERAVKPKAKRTAETVKGTKNAS